MGPTEEGLELTAEEAENDERTHPAHLVDHRFVDILDAGKRFCCHAVGNTGQTEHDKEKGNEALKKRRPYKSMSVLRQDAREKSQQPRWQYKGQMTRPARLSPLISSSETPPSSSSAPGPSYLPKRGSTILMETRAIMKAQRKVETNMKYQLHVTSTAKTPALPKKPSMAWFVRP